VVIETDQDPLAALRERAPEAAALFAAIGGALADSLPAVLAGSDFVLGALARDPALCAALCARAPERLAGAPLPLPPLPTLPADEAQFMAQLRRWRRAEFTRIAWRDLAGWAALDETLADLSRAADLALQLAYAFVLRAATARHGRPLSEEGVPQPLMIVAMGKLGGRELNFSSDVDLVLLYPQGGQTDGARPIGNQEFFTRLAQALVRLLAQPTEEGFVFRVDLRLRPFGDSGPTVCSAAALEDYLQIHGRDWERYAWIKARPLTGEQDWAELFRDAVRPFVYRRYLDFGVFESLQEMKALIEREVQRRDLADDIKLGDGGIREIEFIVQSFQLIRGGQDRRLQASSLLHVLPLLAGAKLLPADAVTELEAAYVFLRRLENRLQMRFDQQVHRLPAGEPERARLAASMGESSWAALHAQLERHRDTVGRHFRAVVFGTPAAGPDGADAAPLPLPLGEDEAAALGERLRALGFPDPEAAARLLGDFRQAAPIRRLDQIGGRRLAALLPVLAAEAARAREPLATLRRLLHVLEAIGMRSAYFALLLHHSRPRQRLVELAAHGDFLTDQIAAHPLLLDELIDERILEQLPDRAELAAELAQRMAGADQDDEEQLLERLRHFQRAALFRLAVADLLNRLPVMRVSDRLTDLAELIVERVLALAWDHLTATLGTPMCGEGDERRPVRIAVIGYGKLGGMELGYASDLDLVFVHDSSGAQQETQGARSIDNQVFFVRFAQRLVHLLTVHSPAGRLYEVDMRLRPSGKAGMLIASIEGFAQYQRDEAWTFEHQALLHARAVAGAAPLRARFEAIRLQVLAHCVRRAQLREDVRHMRNRMRQELSKAGPGQFDVKQDPGGIADIEFLAQYWALKWAEQYPPVAWFSDTIRQLESVASADLIPQAMVDRLTRAYRAYRTCLHHRALDGLGGVIAASEFVPERAAVIAIWDREMSTAAPAA
jgi:glutamate-ammonia-ligase adenylyltransferase